MKKVLVPIDSRANLSRAITLCEAIQEHPQLELQLIIFGPLANSYQYLLPTALTPTVVLYGTAPGGESPDTPLAISNSYAAIIQSLSKTLTVLQPDIVVALTDRFETLAVATCCTLLNFPIAHVQGGELTGTIDEHIRHAVTKLSHIHFVANEESAKVVRSLGESDVQVHVVGCPATDLLLRVDVSSSAVAAAGEYILVLMHPVYTEAGDSYEQMRSVLNGVEQACYGQSRVGDGRVQTIVIGPNHDAGNHGIWKAIKEAGIAAVHDLQFDDFVRLMSNARVFVTNSSAGIREACYFATPVVDVGSRQQGRKPRSSSVVTVQPTSDEVASATISALWKQHGTAEQLYGDGTAGKRIAEILANMEPTGIQKTLVRR